MSPRSDVSTAALHLSCAPNARLGRPRHAIKHPSKTSHTRRAPRRAPVGRRRFARPSPSVRPARDTRASCIWFEPRA
eukprot:6235837-Prymnesium_polylepis.1